MKYNDIRTEIKSGDLLAWTHRGWKTWHDFKIQMVRMFTRSEYSHVGIAWVIAGRVFVIEAVIPKIRIIPLSHELPFYWVPMDAPWKQETEDFALSLVGKGEYSQWEAIKAGLGIDIDADNKKWECAEYVSEVLKLDGIDLGNIATPTAVVDAALKLGKPLRIIE